MHVVWGILPENYVSGMYSSLICCCLLGNVHLNLLSCLSIWADPLLMVGRLYPANLGRFPPPLPSPLLAICRSYTARQAFQEHSSHPVPDPPQSMH